MREHSQTRERREKGKIFEKKRITYLKVARLNLNFNHNFDLFNIKKLVTVNHN